MNLKVTTLTRLGAALLMAMAISACSTVNKGPGGEITKVHYYHLDPLKLLRTEDPAILFEREYHLWGAYTAAQQTERTGNYYAVRWKAADPSGPLTVRLEYRQANSGLEVKKQEQEVTDIGRSNLTRFNVTGPEYQKDGPVSAWKVTVLRGKEELASQASYLWN